MTPAVTLRTLANAAARRSLLPLPPADDLWSSALLSPLVARPDDEPLLYTDDDDLMAFDVAQAEEVRQRTPLKCSGIELNEGDSVDSGPYLHDGIF